MNLLESVGSQLILATATTNQSSTVELVRFVEDNWFVITLLITVISSVWRMSSKVEKFTNEINENNLHTNNKIDEIKKNVDDKIDDMKKEFNVKLDNSSKYTSEQLDQLHNKLDDIEAKRLASTHRTRIIMNGVEATLETLHNQGHNGPVTRSLQEIKDYKSDQAAK